MTFFFAAAVHHDQANEQAAADHLTQRMQVSEKNAWMLRSMATQARFPLPRRELRFDGARASAGAQR